MENVSLLIVSIMVETAINEIITKTYGLIRKTNKIDPISKTIYLDSNAIDTF